MIMKKWYSIYIHEKPRSCAFSAYLHKNFRGRFEPSQCGEGTHFSVYLTPEEVSVVNDYLDTI